MAWEVDLPGAPGGGESARLLERDRLWGSVGTAVVYGVSLGIMAIFAYLVLVGDPDPIDLAFGWIVPVSLFAAILHFDRLIVPEVAADHRFRVSVWFLGGTVLATLLILGSFALLELKGGRVVRAQFVVLVFAGTGSVFGYVMGVYDVERKREAERAERLHTQVSVLNRVLRHDIRNDATVIQGYADLLGDQSSVDDGVIATIDKRVDDIVRLSDTARKLERVMAADETNLSPVDLASVVDEQANRVVEAYPGTALTIETEVDARVYAHDLVGSAVYNVVSNAAEHNDAPDPCVTVHVHPVEDNWVTVRVVDNGPGIPTEERDVLRSGSESALKHSSGLGLWLVNWIVRLSGGGLDIRSRDPRGTEVALFFKRADVDLG